MRKGVVTVVIPVYNVEKYLERCIKSIIHQTYKNLEIILVDDGSTDSCPQICDKWAERDKRIIVIHKKNAGLGMARNTGIDNATGEYICFFDSDDYVALDIIEETYKLAITQNADVVSYGYCRINNAGNISKIQKPCPSKLIYQGNEVQTSFLPSLIAPDIITGDVTNLWMSACGGLYSMKTIKSINWHFVSERQIISEDIYSLLYLYKNVHKVVVLSETPYFYCENTSSLTHSYKEERFEKIKHFYKACIKACNNLNYDDKVKSQLAYPFISNVIAALKILSKVDVPEKEQKIYNILKDPLLENVIMNMDVKHEKVFRKLWVLSVKYKIYWLARIMISIRA